MITNKIFCNHFKTNLTFDEINIILENTKHIKYKYHNGQPIMIYLKLFENEHINLYHSHRFIFFTKGTLNTVNYLNQLINFDFIQSLNLKSITATYNLNKRIILSQLKGVVYEPEIFPAAYIKPSPSVHINIFASGKVVIMGMKKESDLQSLINIVIQIVSK